MATNNVMIKIKTSGIKLKVFYQNLKTKNKNMTNKEKYLSVSKDDSVLLDQIKYRIENREMLREKQKTEILSLIKKENMENKLYSDEYLDWVKSRKSERDLKIKIVETKRQKELNSIVDIENINNINEKYDILIKNIRNEYKPLTNNQVKFAEFMLIKDNAKIISQFGDFEKIFKQVRKYLKD